MHGCICAQVSYHDDCFSKHVSINVVLLPLLLIFNSNFLSNYFFKMNVIVAFFIVTEDDIKQLKSLELNIMLDSDSSNNNKIKIVLLTQWSDPSL